MISLSLTIDILPRPCAGSFTQLPLNTILQTDNTSCSGFRNVSGSADSLRGTLENENILLLTQLSTVGLWFCGSIFDTVLHCTWTETRESMVQWLWLGCLSSDCNDYINNPFITTELSLKSLFPLTCIFHSPRSGTDPCRCHHTACTRRRSGPHRTQCHIPPLHTPWPRPVWGHTPHTAPQWPASGLSCGLTLTRHDRTCVLWFVWYEMDEWKKGMLTICI